jgi:hypothetical protein
MTIRNIIHDYVPWLIIAICLLQLVISIETPTEAIAWIVAAIGWLAFKIER